MASSSFFVRFVCTLIYVLVTVDLFYSVNSKCPQIETPLWKEMGMIAFAVSLVKFTEKTGLVNKGTTMYRTN